VCSLQPQDEKSGRVLERELGCVAVRVGARRIGAGEVDDVEGLSTPERRLWILAWGYVLPWDGK